MRLFLPFTGVPVALPMPSAMWRVNGKWAGFHEVTPASAEIPVLDVSHCTACGSKADADVKRCIKPTCPSRPRKAA